MAEILLELNDLRIAFHAGREAFEAVSGVSLKIHRGEVVSLVGESGSGKSVTALSITRLLPDTSLAYVRGNIFFDGQELNGLPEKRMQALRGKRIAYVFQEPASALNPVFTVAYQIAETLKLHQGGGSYKEKVLALLASVGIDEPVRVAAAYPHQCSGGQLQRVVLAIALAGEPDLLIADEPTTALDVTVQAQILDLLQSIQTTRGMAVLLITHNLAIASRLSRRMYVMYAGQVVETGNSRQLLREPGHPYTRALLKAIPRLHGASEKLEGIPGMIPSGGSWPAGCRFHTRCPMARDRCQLESPPMSAVSDDHDSRCLFWNEVSPQ